MHLSKQVKKKRDMPSLKNDFFSSSSESEKAVNLPFIKLPCEKTHEYNKIKKTIQRKKFVEKSKSRERNCTKKFLSVQKIVERNNECLTMLEKGLKPVFKIIPGNRPYIFKGKKSSQRKKHHASKVISLIIPNVEQLNTSKKQFEVQEKNEKSMFRSLEDIIKAQKQNEAHFFSSVNSLMEDFNINEFKVLKKDTSVQNSEVYDSMHTKSQPLFIDGANDVSSDDDGDKNTRRKHNRKIRNKTYSSLPIYKKSSVAPGIPIQVSRLPNLKMETEGDCELSQVTSCDNIQKIKRKLSFDLNLQEKTKVAGTITGETKVSRNKDKKNSDISRLSTDDSECSPEDSLSTSALYDIVNDFRPEQGTSKSKDEEAISPTTPISSMCSNFQDFHAEENFDGDIVEAVQSSDSSSVMLYGQKQENRIISALPAVLCDSSPSSTYFRPQYKAPSRSDVEKSLSQFNIPKIKAKEPFYSDVNDATGSLEVGYSILKVKSLTCSAFPSFESSYVGLETFRKNNFPESQPKCENLRYLYCGQNNTIMEPAKKPPTRIMVVEWSKQKKVESGTAKTPKTKKSKVYVRSSQGDNSDDSLDLSLTLTPMSPQTNCGSPIVCTSESESNLDSELSDSKEFSDVTHTPKSHKQPSRRRKHVDSSSVLRKSTLLSQLSEHSGVISGVTLNNTYGFKNSLQNYQKARAAIEHEYLTIFAMELHVNTRGEFKPNPEYDEIQAIFYSISNDVKENYAIPRRAEGAFVVLGDNKENNPSFLAGSSLSFDVKYIKNELELFEEFAKFVIKCDPDILIGYEIQMLSWGYLVERCHRLGVNIIPELSRVKDKQLRFNEKEKSDLKITGRVVLDFWRLLRHEIALQSYTLQSVVYEILQKRLPKYSFRDLTGWWRHETNLFRHRVVDYYLTCVQSVLKLLEQLDLVGRTSELARLFGIQFFEVLSRGSQFRVESMMLRLAKPLNYVAVSPSIQQRAKMKAPEFIALVLEPESKLYNDPVIVLDFQSLYPSIIIAYNYCFSTCLGRVELLGRNSAFEFGATNLKVPRERIKFLVRKDLVNYSPCGVAFVKKKVRDGIMPRMLREILDTRLMVKKSMKENKEDALLQKVLHNRQLGLKLIANVTYGYTAANFSGRMPAVELGDSIVSKARETLQRTIALVDGNEMWGARVVYGDTDSLFVHCPGKSREEAFAIGEQIVKAVGEANPDPVKLKLEKVYQPCILQTKKRYVGYMYETPDQKEPTYEAKGIETVRRDGCPAVSKMLEKSLRILFETKDVSNVKRYCVKQFNKIILGRISIQDLTFAKEFRGLTGYRPGACVPSLELAKRWVATDKRAEPRRGERVPYVIINGPPGVPLIRLVRSPQEVLNDPALRANALYYITRVIIPPLNRCFNLIGTDLNHWFQEMPRKQLQYLPIVNSPTKKSTISQYFVSTLCAVCGIQAQNGLCQTCLTTPLETVTVLSEKIRRWEASYSNCRRLCSLCTQILDDSTCISLDCPVLYRSHQTRRDLQQADHIRQLLEQNFDIF